MNRCEPGAPASRPARPVAGKVAGCSLVAGSWRGSQGIFHIHGDEVLRFFIHRNDSDAPMARYQADWEAVLARHAELAAASELRRSTAARLQLQGRFCLH